MRKLPPDLSLDWERESLKDYIYYMEKQKEEEQELWEHQHLVPKKIIIIDNTTNKINTEEVIDELENNSLPF